jgi:enamine deaminase RidA (YjgF/YER057c/UK114 family)
MALGYIGDAPAAVTVIVVAALAHTDASVEVEVTAIQSRWGRFSI